MPCIASHVCLTPRSPLQSTGSPSAPHHLDLTVAVQGSPHIHPVSHSPPTVDARGIFPKHRPGPLPFTLLKTRMASTRLWINPKVLTVAQETPARRSWLTWAPPHGCLPSIPTCAPFPFAPTPPLPPAALHTRFPSPPPSPCPAYPDSFLRPHSYRPLPEGPTPWSPLSRSGLSRLKSSCRKGWVLWKLQGEKPSPCG